MVKYGKILGAMLNCIATRSIMCVATLTSKHMLFFERSEKKQPQLLTSSVVISLDIQSYFSRFGVLGTILGSSHTFSFSVFGCQGYTNMDDTHTLGIQ